MKTRNSYGRTFEASTRITAGRDCIHKSNGKITIEMPMDIFRVLVKKQQINLDMGTIYVYEEISVALFQSTVACSKLASTVEATTQP